MKALDTKNLARALFELTDGATAEESSAAVKDFAKYLHKQGVLREADKIIAEYQKIYNKKNGIIEATVTLINRLPDKTTSELTHALKEKYKVKEVHILEKVDERLLGGMKIRIGDTVYDSSVAHSLKQLEAQLLK